jgi:hypothetical protein
MSSVVLFNPSSSDCIDCGICKEPCLNSQELLTHDDDNGKKHPYHKGCLGDWLVDSKHDSCPGCNTKFNPSSIFSKFRGRIIKHRLLRNALVTGVFTAALSFLSNSRYEVATSALTTAGCTVFSKLFANDSNRVEKIGMIAAAAVALSYSLGMSDYAISVLYGAVIPSALFYMSNWSEALLASQTPLKQKAKAVTAFVLSPLFFKSANLAKVAQRLLSCDLVVVGTALLCNDLLRFGSNSFLHSFAAGAFYAAALTCTDPVYLESYAFYLRKA